MAPNLWRGRFLGLQETTLEVEQNLRRQLQEARERAQWLDSRVRELEAEAAEVVVELRLEKQNLTLQLEQARAELCKAKQEQSEERLKAEEAKRQIQSRDLLLHTAMLSKIEERSWLSSCMMSWRSVALTVMQRRAAAIAQLELLHRRSQQQLCSMILQSWRRSLAEDGAGRPIFKAATPPPPRCGHSWRSRAYVVKEQDRLKVAEWKLERLGKALRGLLSDSFTEELMEDPVMTPDGTTYDSHSIKKWINSSPTDPRTRLPLSAEMLLPNRQARAILGLFRSTFPEFQAANEATAHASNSTRAPDVGKQLFNAMIKRQEKKALELLPGLADDELNAEYENNGKKGSLLFWAMDCTGLVNLAVALVRRDNFRAMFFPTPYGISHLHYAAALGLLAVCRELLKRQPLRMALAFTREPITIRFPNGEGLRIPANSTAMSLARQLGHVELLDLFNMTIIQRSLTVPTRNARLRMPAWSTAVLLSRQLLSTIMLDGQGTAP